MRSIFISLLLLLAVGTAQAATITVEAEQTRTGNCLPFGCAGYYASDRHIGYIYQNIPAFSLRPGDTLGFDLMVPNDVPLQFDIAMAQTATNGGTKASDAGYTSIVANGTGTGLGNAVIGDYDLAFTVTGTFDFSGGGLIIDFLPRGETAFDDDPQYNQVGGHRGDSSGYFLASYYFEPAPPTEGQFDSNFDITNFQIQTTVVPIPAAAWLFASALICVLRIPLTSPKLL